MLTLVNCVYHTRSGVGWRYESGADMHIAGREGEREAPFPAKVSASGVDEDARWTGRSEGWRCAKRWLDLITHVAIVSRDHTLQYTGLRAVRDHAMETQFARARILKVKYSTSPSCCAMYLINCRVRYLMAQSPTTLTSFLTHNPWTWLMPVERWQRVQGRKCGGR
nr:hypothetical protein CFP56_33409 [Quercus suber]